MLSTATNPSAVQLECIQWLTKLTKTSALALCSQVIDLDLVNDVGPWLVLQPLQEVLGGLIE